MPADTLTDIVAPDGKAPDTTAKPVKLQALGTREYVAGSNRGVITAVPEVLSQAIDDIAADYGTDVYLRMLADSQVRSTVNVFKAAVLEDGISVRSAVEQKGDDGYQQAADLAAAAEQMLGALDTSLDDVLWDMLDAVVLGNRIAEQVYEADGAQFLLQRLSVKPVESAAFVVDSFLNVLGIMAIIPGQTRSFTTSLLTDLKGAPNILPRSKFAVLSFRPRNNDPRGTSILRSAYAPWFTKQTLYRDFVKYLSQFATPSLVGFTPEGAEPYQVAGSDGAPLVDGNGNPVMRSPEQDMVDALENFANGTVTAFPFGGKVQPIEMSGEGQAYLNAFEFLNREITKAVLHQTLATEEGLHQTRASSSTHKDILDTITRQAKRPVERMLERDVLHTWMRLNGQESLLKFCPRITLGETEQEDMPAFWLATAALQKAGYLDASQFPELDRQMGLPEREAAMTPAEQQAVQQGQQAQDAAPSVPQPQFSGSVGDDEIEAGRQILRDGYAKLLDEKLKGG